MRHWLTVLSCGLAFWTGCGGGNGIGPDEIRKREGRLRDQLPLSWNFYNQGQYEEAVDAFTRVLEDADNIEGIDDVRNEIKSEAQNGIGWAFFRLQKLQEALVAFNLATRLDRSNADAWVGAGGVSLAQRDYGGSVQFGTQALELDAAYNSGSRIDADGRLLGHDNFDRRQVRLLLAEAYFQLGRYSAADRPDPNNSAAQLRLVSPNFRFRDPGQLLEGISQFALDLQDNAVDEP